MSLTVTSTDSSKGAASILLAREILSRAKAVLLDWDGCIAFGNKPTPSAVRFVAEFADRVAIVSNNSTNQPEQFAELLAGVGVQIPSERIILAGVEAITRAREIGAGRVMLLADSRMKALGRKCGLNIARDEADLVLLLRDTRINYYRLERAANCLRAGAKLIVSNPDANHRGARGKLVPETGALLAALQACAGNIDFEMEVIGKPSRRLFDRACQALNVSPEAAVMIGDNPATDVAGAKAIGMSHILIGADGGVEFKDLLGEEPHWNNRPLVQARSR